jgi:hypothetical protein
MSGVPRATGLTGAPRGVRGAPRGVRGAPRVVSGAPRGVRGAPSGAIVVTGLTGLIGGGWENV